MTDEFNSKLADALWALLEPRIEQKLAQFRDEIGTFDGDLDDQISSWMNNNFNLDDYGFNIEDYSYNIDSMIDAQVEYLASDGELKSWLKDDDPDADDDFDVRVFKAINNNYSIQLVRR